MNLNINLAFKTVRTEPVEVRATLGFDKLSPNGVPVNRCTGKNGQG
jgi:hypothetical protein